MVTAEPQLSELSDTDVAALARKIRLELVTLSQTHPRRADLMAEWRHCIRELSGRAISR
jgi:hypothetical protein